MNTSSKFKSIEKRALDADNLLSIAAMCRLSGVSRSGYYNWLGNSEKRQTRELKDRADFKIILGAYRHRGYDKGVNGIYMRLAHKGIRMNRKKIRRLMHKYGLKCPIRSANPHRRMAKALKTSNYADNVVKRNFHRGVRKVLLTDISYIPYNGTFAYLSTIIDAMTREVLAYQLSRSLRVEFVLKTVDELVAKHGSTLDNETIVHSDQGCHYTSYAFIEKLRDENFVQSMSRRGNCWDNAPQESFFGHMKDEIMGKIQKCKIFEEVEEIVDDWIEYYNAERYQWGLKMLSPRQFYDFLTLGIDPLADFRAGKI